MQQFIVLGLIPGTNIQIGFAFVAILGLIFLTIVFKWYIGRYREVKLMVNEITQRHPLPAKAYHIRSPQP